jgi:methyl-accepting chemotaxis protein
VIAGLSVYTISLQRNVYDILVGTVGDILKGNNDKILKDLKAFNVDSQKALEDLSVTSTNKLTEASKTAFDNEKELLGKGYEASMREDAESVASLLAKVAPQAILSKDFSSLVSYVKAVDENPNVLFVFYFAKSGKPLTRYMNKKDPKIKDYLSSQGKDKIGKVINGASHDEDVFLVEKPVALEGELIGKVILCVSRSAAKKRIEEMSGRFEALIESNSNTITDVIGKESKKVEALTSQLIGTLSEASAKDTAAAGSKIKDISDKAILHVQNASILGGIIGLGLILLVVVLVAFQITSPISKMVEFSDSISRGDFDLNIDMDREDEIGKLIDSMRAMVKGLQAKANLAAAISEGDLTEDVELASDKDKLGKAFKVMVDRLNSVISRVRASADQVDLGSTQVSDSSQALSQGATEQAASLEQITSSMNEIGFRTKTNAENAVQANDLAKTARDAAEGGNSQMSEMIAAMSDIQESSKEIAKIIKTIDDIAFQTNLLALNAAVEAARAGKHGKGFAVVAQEVRNLAGRSAKAARETTELIEGSVKRVDRGTNIVNQTAESLAGIVQSVTKTADLVGEIAAASNEQAQGISQINQGLEQLDQVTQSNTASAEETASAAEELSSQAGELKAALSRFQVKSNGAGDDLATFTSSALLEEHPESGPEAWDDPEFSAVEGQEIGPSDVIGLDDSEFDKY